MTGFFCEHAIDMAQADKEALVLEQMREKKTYIEAFQDIFQEMDEDRSGKVSFNEMQTFMENEQFQAYLSHVNISSQSAWTIFRLLDDDSSGAVTIEEFVTGLLRLRGPAKTIDLRDMHRDVTRLGTVLEGFMQFTEEKLDKISYAVVSRQLGKSTASSQSSEIINKQLETILKELPDKVEADHVPQPCCPSKLQL
eukprot:TRINITY_DN21362_c0_g1_i1.p1 TRINITY_DN21362_c0_g1~~TRINITY_DN21362_c0_g1_i1.p1  ORF type:complete len:196 (+),score=53.37 TRINITY_DN21362_c0_g1_i1:120-707(+)